MRTRLSVASWSHPGDKRRGHSRRKRLASLKFLASSHSQSGEFPFSRCTKIKSSPGRGHSALHSVYSLLTVSLWPLCVTHIRASFPGTVAAQVWSVWEAWGGLRSHSFTSSTLLQIVFGLRFPGPQTFFEEHDQWSPSSRHALEFPIFLLNSAPRMNPSWQGRSGRCRTPWACYPL